MIWILPNLAKYNYGWSPIEQHHKIEKKKSLDDPRIIIFWWYQTLGDILKELAKLVEFTLGKNKIPAFLSKPNK
jgi:hypothetical protein